MYVYQIFKKNEKNNYNVMIRHFGQRLVFIFFVLIQAYQLITTLFPSDLASYLSIINNMLVRY